jgi:hypothetical protein
MKTALLALVALAACAVAFAREGDQAKDDLKALAGTWEYVSQTDDGKDGNRRVKGTHIGV